MKTIKPGANGIMSEDGSRIAISADGVPIQYQISGSGSMALVFVHGWLSDHRCWSQQVDYFASQYTVVTIDLAGHGASGHDRSQWTMTGFGLDVAAVVEQERLEQAVLIGHSMGGLAIVEAARRLPQVVKGVIGVDTWWDVEHPKPPDQVDAMLAPLRAHYERAAPVVARRMFAGASNAGLVDGMLKAIGRTPASIAIGSLGESMTHDLREGLRGIKTPKIAINATEFRSTDKEAAERYDIELVLLSGVSHFLMLDAPQKFNSLLDRAARNCFQPRFSLNTGEAPPSLADLAGQESGSDRTEAEGGDTPRGFTKLGKRIASYFMHDGSPPRLPPASQIVTATLGLAGPIAVGAMLGHPRLGMMASLGGLALGGAGAVATARERARGLLYGLAGGSAAV